MSKAKWSFNGTLAVVPAYEFCSFDPESKDYTEWVQEQPDDFRVRIGKCAEETGAQVTRPQRSQRGAAVATVGYKCNNCDTDLNDYTLMLRSIGLSHKY